MNSGIWRKDSSARISRKQTWPGIPSPRPSKGIGELLPLLTSEDVLLVMADHGNDPAIGHSRHTRECVPLLVYKKGVTGKRLGTRKTLSDVGASVCDSFGEKAPQNGSSFMEYLKRTE